MAIVGLGRLVKKDLFTAELWNTLIDILEAKFAGGVSFSDIQWPLLVQGDIDFQQQNYTILGLRKFWKVVNAAEYSSLDTCVAAVAGTAGGVAIFIPPSTTVQASSALISASNITIFGAGPTSVIKITASGTGPMITTGTGGLSNIWLMNLALDGTGGGAGCIGVSAKRVARFQMLNVAMTAFTGDFIVLTNGGVAGQGCADAYLGNIHCSGGSDSHLVADDVSGLIVDGFVSKSATGDAISMVPAGAANLIQDVVLSNVRVHTGGAKGIRIVGSGAAGIDAHSRIRLSGCHVVSVTGLPYELGNTSALLKDLTVHNCFAPASLSDGMRIATNRGEIDACHIPAAVGDGLDITNSVDLWVHGNNCQDAGAYGINATSTTDCTVVGNNLRDAVTDGINRTTNTGLRAYENVGDDAPSVGNSFSDGTPRTLSGTATGDFGFSYTIPANSLRPGDLLQINFLGIAAAGGTSGVVAVNLNAVTFYTWTVVTTTDNFFMLQVRAAQGSASHTMAFRITEDRTPGDETLEIDNNTPTIDWTVDQVLKFNCNSHGGSGDITIDQVAVCMYGSR